MVGALVGLAMVGLSPQFPVGKTPILILTYHDVILKRDQQSVWFDCTVAELRSQIVRLKKVGATFVSIREVANHMRNGYPLPKRPVAITFADNYQGFADYGWPVLRDQKIPVTMFVHTGHVGSQKGRPKMSWDTLRSIGKSKLFTVGSQTVSHPADLTKLMPKALVQEFGQSRATLMIEAQGFYIDVIAYPNGKFNVKVAEQARKSGYTMGFTETQEPSHRAPDAWRVSRYVHTQLEQGIRECFNTR